MRNAVEISNENKPHTTQKKQRLKCNIRTEVRRVEFCAFPP